MENVTKAQPVQSGRNQAPEVSYESATIAVCVTVVILTVLIVHIISATFAHYMTTTSTETLSNIAESIEELQEELDVENVSEQFDRIVKLHKETLVLFENSSAKIADATHRVEQEHKEKLNERVQELNVLYGEQLQAAKVQLSATYKEKLQELLNAQLTNIPCRACNALGRIGVRGNECCFCMGKASIQGKQCHNCQGTGAVIEKAADCEMCVGKGYFVGIEPGLVEIKFAEEEELKLRHTLSGVETTESSS